MKVTPLSIAVRIIAIPSRGSFGWPIWYPPTPMSETFAPVRPSVRYCIPPDRAIEAKALPAVIEKIALTRASIAMNRRLVTSSSSAASYTHERPDSTSTARACEPLKKKSRPTWRPFSASYLMTFGELSSRGLPSVRPLRAVHARARRHDPLRRLRCSLRRSYCRPCLGSCEAEPRRVHAGDGPRRQRRPRRLHHFVPRRLFHRRRVRPARSGYRQLSC